MKRVYKEQFKLISEPQKKELPKNSKIVKVGNQNGMITMWFECYNPTDDWVEQRTFCVYGTGHDIKNEHEYIGTAVTNPFVWHLYEIKN